MKAIRLEAIGEPLQMQEVPLPDVGEEDVLIQVRAAGICHSDEHYRSGVGAVTRLPLTLGHEVAGAVERVGARVSEWRPGDRVCLHYLATCGRCEWCLSGNEQFCPSAQMIGKDRDGGYAQFIAMPARSLVPLPAGIPFEHGAVMMCSTATVFHALHKGRMRAGERVAVFGVGGLGISAIQLARVMGALQVFAVDLSAEKLRLAGELGAIPVPAGKGEALSIIREQTGGRGVDVSLELAGASETMKDAVECLGRLGRAVFVGIGRQPLEIDVYRTLLAKEAEVIGCSDHLGRELPLVLEFAQQGRLDLSRVVTQTVPLEADAVNGVLQDLRLSRGQVRSVIVPDR